MGTKTKQKNRVLVDNVCATIQNVEYAKHGTKGVSEIIRGLNGGHLDVIGLYGILQDVVSSLDDAEKNLKAICNEVGLKYDTAYRG